jgi:hypothetical protein
MYIVLIVVCNVEKREDPKGTSQPSLKYTEEPTEPQQPPTAVPLPRRSTGRAPTLESTVRDNDLYRRNGAETAPFISNSNQQRQPRPGDVNASASLPEYNRPNDREYPISTRKKSGPGESSDAGYFVGYSPEHEQPLPYVEYFTFMCSFFQSGPAVARLTRLNLICALVF